MARTYKRRAPLAALLGFCAVVGAPSPAAADDLDALCAEPIAELRRVQAMIRIHNAKPRVSSDRGYVSAYNAEARSLNAQQAQAISRARQCVSAFSRVRRNHPASTFARPTPGQVAPLTTAVRNLTEAERRAVTRWNPKIYDFLDYGPGKKGMTTRVDRTPPRLPPPVRAVYKALDSTRPDIPRTTRLQGKPPPTVGAPDPAYTNGRRVTGVAFDHIIPLRRLVTMRNFLKLTPQNMWLVANSPANSQWLSKKANSSKLSGSSAFVSGADPAWLREQAQLRERAERELQELIDALLRTQKG
ncbi:hypothetical protein GCM10009678_90210 [Actinomadura kijaniata]|uniref:HNH endonuclease n=1 Tax=Actinomadura namibiensis TaxID=182080 RepID=A0A7W3LT06_ACTNM|nr:hypothetical protein [Actinomadura namibiensis]MBA8953753.1 hypothetical protein [Actinomadura namibiensis]